MSDPQGHGVPANALQALAANAVLTLLARLATLALLGLMGWVLQETVNNGRAFERLAGDIRLLAASDAGQDKRLDRLEQRFAAGLPVLP